MKRLLMIILSLSMVCTIFAYPAMAADTTSVPLKTSYVTASGQQVSHITFNNTAKTTLDSLTRAKQNMAALGFEQDWIDTLSEEEILDYADIEDANITTSFFKLRALTDEEQITRQYYEDNNLMDEYIDPREFEVIPESQYINETEIAPLDAEPEPNDNGYIIVTATSVKYSSNPKNYKLSGRYEWTKMPTNRYTDYFAVSHSTGITEYPDTFYSVTKHSFDHYDWYIKIVEALKKQKIILNPTLIKSIQKQKVMASGHTLVQVDTQLPILFIKILPPRFLILEQLESKKSTMDIKVI